MVEERKYVEYLPLLNFDETYRKSINPQIIPCEANGVRTKQQIKEFMSYIFTESGLCDVMVPSCECGKTKGGYRVGTYCQRCNTIVKPHNSVKLGYNTWIKTPEAVPPLLQPLAYHVLSNWIKTNQSKITLDMLLDPDGYKLLPPAASEGIKGTGITYFYHHFDDIMRFLLYQYRPLMIRRPMKQKDKNGEFIIKLNEQSANMEEWLKINREALFASHFPALDKSLHVLTKQGDSLTNSDDTSEYILKTALEVANLNVILSLYPDNLNAIERGAHSIIKAYAQYSAAILDENLLTKQGYIRRHILGSRCHFSFRAVITPITDLGMPDEIYIPWRIGVLQLKLQIINLLISRYRMSFLDAQAKHQAAIDRYDKEIDEIFQTLIKECRYKGLPCLWGRNPSHVF